jgi:hypothetical protein
MIWFKKGKTVETNCCYFYTDAIIDFRPLLTNMGLKSLYKEYFLVYGHHSVGNYQLSILY